MADIQLNLFEDWEFRIRSETVGTAPSDSDRTIANAIETASLNDEELVDRLAGARTPGAAEAYAREATGRKLHAAIPALEKLCHAVKGFGRDSPMREQRIALAALQHLGCPKARDTMKRLIIEDVFDAPIVSEALATAAALDVYLPARRLRDNYLLHDSRDIRYHACRLVKHRHHVSQELWKTLHDCAQDLSPEVNKEATLALARLGDPSVRANVLRLLREEPTDAVIEAAEAIANEDMIMEMARTASRDPTLSSRIAVALETIGTDHAYRVGKRYGVLSE